MGGADRLHCVGLILPSRNFIIIVMMNDMVVDDDDNLPISLSTSTRPLHTVFLPRGLRQSCNCLILIPFSMHTVLLFVRPKGRTVIIVYHCDCCYILSYDIF